MTPTRAARCWAQLGLHVVLLLVGFALIQVAAERTNRRFDLTPTRAQSLAPLTEKLLRQIDGPLAVTVFFRRGTREQYADLLGRLRAANAHVEVALLDLDRFPERARGLGVEHYGSASLTYRGRHAVVPAANEEQLAGGILHVLRGKPRRMVFTTGHGERVPAGGDEGYGRLSAALDGENWVVGAAGLLDGGVPEDTEVLVVAGPRHDFLPQETDAVARYLHAGGGVLMLLDPGSLPNLARLLTSMGLRLGDDFVVDRERRLLGTDGLAAVVEAFKDGNDVSGPIDTGVVLPSARTIEVVEEVPGVDAESVARTAETSWAIADPARARAGDEPSAAKHDRRGPASVVVMAQLGPGADGDAGRGRLVVVGDADFASDAYLELLGNRDLALNAVAWAGREGVLAGVRKKRIPEIIRPLSPLVLTEAQARGIFLTTVVAQPGLVLLIGGVVSALRRRRG
jgi:ABC-type uncharacterized transport system involved in gliding motility auxiliary subunit